MIAIFVDRLHAKRAGDLIFDNGDSKAVGNGQAEVPRLENGVATILFRG